MLKQEFKACSTFWNKYNLAGLHKQKRWFAINKNVAFGCSVRRPARWTCLNVLHSLIERSKYNTLASGPANVTGNKPSILGLLPHSSTNFSTTVYFVGGNHKLSALTMPHKLLQLAITQTHLESPWLCWYSLAALHLTAVYGQIRSWSMPAASW